FRQRVEVGDGVYQALFGQLDGHRFPQPVDSHGSAGGKMDQVAQTLRGAFRVDAAQRGLPFQVDHRFAAAGADGGHLEGTALGAVGGNGNHFGDNVAGFTHLDGIADAHAQAVDDVPVMQAG